MSWDLFSITLTKMRLVLFLTLSFFLKAGGQTSVVWASDFGALNRQSDGVSPLTSDFEFVLGSFVGITPRRDNVDEWEDAFQPFGTANYIVGQQRFSQSQTLTSNNPPFTTSTRPYIWGRNGTESGSEWILFGAPTWTWPVVNTGGPPPFPVSFLITALTQEDALVGSINEAGFLMQTELVVFDFTYEDWVASVFSAGDATAHELDFDGDGRSNFLEYALDSDPKSPDPPFQVALEDGFLMEIPRVPGRQVNWQIQSSDDLSGFTTMTTGFEIVIDEPERLVIQINPPFGDRKFFRLQAVPVP